MDGTPIPMLTPWTPPLLQPTAELRAEMERLGVLFEYRYDRCLQGIFFFAYHMEGAKRHRSRTMRCEKIEQIPAAMRAAFDDLKGRLSQNLA